jgi:hypothetical protein
MHTLGLAKTYYLCISQLRVPSGASRPLCDASRRESTHRHAHTHTHTDVHSYAQTCSFSLSLSLSHTHTHIHTHSHTHTHTCSQLRATSGASKRIQTPKYAHTQIHTCSHSRVPSGAAQFTTRDLICPHTCIKLYARTHTDTDTHTCSQLRATSGASRPLCNASRRQSTLHRKHSGRPFT